MSLLFRCALPLTLLACAGTAATTAQTPAVPAALLHHLRPHHAPVLLAPPASTPALAFGRSRVSLPRSGRGAASGLLTGREALIGLAASLDPWTQAGPATLMNGGGAFGGINQNVSGRITGIAPDPTAPNTYYIASAGGGVWKTTDAGQTYIPLTDFLGDTAMGSIVVAPSNHNVIYAGTGEANFASDSRYGIGLLRSTDAGATWSVIPGPTSASSPQGVFYRKAISRIVVDPTNANVVYLGTVVAGLNGNNYADGGVWKTTDGGSTWINTTAGKVDNNALYTDVVMNSHDTNILYTAVGYPGSFADNGVYKTTNGGTTWTKLTGGLPIASNGDPVGGQITLALYSSADGASDTLYASIPSAGTAAAKYADRNFLLGLYKSTDSGATFTKLNVPDYLTGQAFYDNAVVVSPSNPNVFFAAGKVNYDAVNGFVSTPTNYNDLRTLVGTTDGGVTFHDFSLGHGYVGPHTDTHALAFTPNSHLLDGNDGGIWRLENPLVANPTPPGNDMDASNIDWTDINGNLNTLQFTGIALDPANASVAYGGSQDNGTGKETTGHVWNQVRGGDGGFVRVDASNPQTVYHEYYGISLERSDDGGQTWNDATQGINQDDPSPNFNEVGSLSGLTDPAAFYVPFKLDPLNTSHVIYGTNHIYLSANRGSNFAAIGIPGTNGFGANVSAGATVDALGVAGQTIYAEIGKRVFATFDGGATWVDRSIPATLNKDSLSDIHVNPANPQDVYATKPAFDDRSVGKVFRSTNGGQNWTNISGNLPDIPFNAVRLDRKSGTLYAAADNGVYATTNYGGSWTRIPGSLPTVAVTDIDLSGPTGLLGAGTHGRGLWTMPLSTVVATPNLKLNAGVIRVSATTVQVTLTLSNFGASYTPTGVGAADALNTVLNVSLAGKAAASIAVGPVPANGYSQSFLVSFTNVPAGYAALHYTGTYTGSNFAGSQRVSVP